MLKSNLPPYTSIISSPIGKIGIVLQDNKLIKLTLLPDTDSTLSAQDNLSQHITDELNHYFHNPQHHFKINFQLHGTPFQQKVWQALQKIPSGKTVSYGTLAQQLQTSPRAIGQGCRTNPILIIVPCHRIIAANHLGGFAGTTSGSWMQIKSWLLRHEERA